MNLRDLGVSSLEEACNEYCIARNDVLDKTLRKLKDEGIMTERLPVFLSLGLSNYRGSFDESYSLNVWQRFRSFQNDYVEANGKGEPITFDPPNWQNLAQILIDAISSIKVVDDKYGPIILAEITKAA
jgi:hypothetical protein